MLSFKLSLLLLEKKKKDFQQYDSEFLWGRNGWISFEVVLVILVKWANPPLCFEAH